MLVLVAVGLLFHFTEPNKPIHFDDRQGATHPDNTVTPQAAESSNAAGQVDEPTPTQPLSGRVTETPSDTEAETAQEPPPAPTRISVLDRVQSAVQGQELESAYPASLSLAECRSLPRSDPTWDEARGAALSSEEFLNSAVGRHVVLQREIRDVSFEQMHAECGALNKRRSQSEFEAISTKAQNGDPFARFIYAMWPPTDEASLAVGVEESLAYEYSALDFTLENLEEGHPLGLLALGLSYSQGHYFTPWRRSLGVSLLVAAQLCSGNTFQVDHQIELYLQSPKHHVTNYPSNEQVLELGAKLHDRYCATSIARTQN